MRSAPAGRAAARRRGTGLRSPPAGVLVAGGAGLVGLAVLVVALLSGKNGAPVGNPDAKAEEKPRVLTESEWSLAKNLASEGIRLASDAERLRAAGDEAGFQRLAREAAAKLDRAIAIWTDWVDSVPAEVADKYAGYGENVRRWNLRRRSLPR